MAIIGTSQVSAASIVALSDLVNLNLQRATVMRPFLLDRSSEAVQGVKTINFRKFTDLSAVTKASGTPLTFQASTLSVDALNLDQHKAVPFEIERFAQIQGPAAFMEELSQNAAIKLAQAYDAYLIGVVDAGAATGSLPTGAGIVDKAAVIAVKKALDLAEVPQANRYLGIHPTEYAKLLAISEFVDANTYGQANIPSGVVGQLFGLQVVMNTGFATGQLLGWEYSAAVGAIQLQPEVTMQPSVPNLSEQWAIHTIYGAKMLQAAKAIKLT